jgi:hypothetical protein
MAEGRAARLDASRQWPGILAIRKIAIRHGVWRLLFPIPGPIIVCAARNPVKGACGIP